MVQWMEKNTLFSFSELAVNSRVDLSLWIALSRYRHSFLIGRTIAASRVT